MPKVIFKKSLKFLHDVLFLTPVIIRISIFFKEVSRRSVSLQCSNQRCCLVYRQIEPSYGSALTVAMDVNACIGTLNEVRHLEHVQCKVTLRFFPRGNLRLLLTSPMGTTSTLLFERPRDVVSSNFDDWPFLSVHFWGERAEGRWTLQIINAGNRHVNQPGGYWGSSEEYIIIVSDPRVGERCKTSILAAV